MMKKSSKKKKQSRKRSRKTADKAGEPRPVEYVENLMELNKMQGTLLKKLHKLL